MVLIVVYSVFRRMGAFFGGGYFRLTLDYERGFLLLMS